MRILMVSSFLPYPLFSGGHIRLYNLLKQLSKNHQITLICEKRDWQTENDVLEIKKFCSVFTVPRKKQWSMGNILKTGFSKYPFLVVGHTSEEMKKKIKNVLEEEKFDLIHAETFYIMQNIPKTRLPIVLAEHNIEYLVYKRFADQASLFLKPFYYLDVLKMKSVEQNYWKKAEKLVAVSEDEKQLMRREDVDIVSNGVDIKNFKFQISNFKYQMREKRVLFIGDFKWLQNRDSTEWILREIWQEIKSKIKNQPFDFAQGKSSKFRLKLWIVGRNIPDSIKEMAKEERSVIFEEEAEDTAEIFNKSFLLLAPIRVGGGTSYKILEAMASGVPVITTSLGIEGIEAENLKNVIISENPGEISKSIISLLGDERLYESISKNARKLIEEKYNWELIVKKLEKVYDDAVKI